MKMFIKELIERFFNVESYKSVYTFAPGMHKNSKEYDYLFGT